MNNLDIKNLDFKNMSQEDIDKMNDYLESCTGNCESCGKDCGSQVTPRIAKATYALFSGKGVTKMSISVHGEGFRYKGEEELSLHEVRKLWGAGQSVELSCFEREGDAAPYLKGKFVITKVEETSPAQDDATFTVDFENDGEPEVYPGQDGAPVPGGG